VKAIFQPSNALRAGHASAEGIACVTRHGVTLLEAILAVVVLSTAMVATSMTIGPSFLSSTATRNVVSDEAGLLRLARQEAILKKTPVDVELLGRPGRQRLLLTVQANSFDPGSITPWPVDPLVQITGSPNRIRFLATGDADRSLRWECISGNSQRTVQVQAAGGRISQK